MRAKYASPHDRNEEQGLILVGYWEIGCIPSSLPQNAHDFFPGGHRSDRGMDR